MRLATTCCCGLRLDSGVRWYAIYDVVVGCLFSIMFIAVLLRTVRTPDFSIYWVTFTTHHVCSGPLAALAGFLGLRGLQKSSPKLLNTYRFLKAIQVTLVIASALLALCDLNAVVEEQVDEVIARLEKEAADRGWPDPVIDRDALTKTMLTAIKGVTVTTLTLWSTCGMYGLYVIHSLAEIMRRGFNVGATQFEVRLPETAHEAGRIQYESPLLQGQSPTIPVRIN